MQKANKTCDIRFALTTEATGALSNHLRHLLEWVLEARANKWSQRAPMLQISHPEGRTEKKRREKEARTTRGDQAC